MTHFQVREASSILCDGLSLRATAPDYTWNGTGQVAVTGLQAICSSSMPSNTASPHSRAPRNIWLWGVTRETSYLMPKPIKALWKYDSNCSVVFGMFAGHNSWHLIMSWYLTAQPPLSWAGTTGLKGKGMEEEKKEEGTPCRSLKSADWSLMHRKNNPSGGDPSQLDENSLLKMICAPKMTESLKLRKFIGLLDSQVLNNPGQAYG